MKNLNYKNKIYYILIISLALLFQNCELFGDDNDIPQFPEATQTGKGTFGFKLNGEIINVTNTSDQVAIYQSGILQLAAGVTNKTYKNEIQIILEDPLQINKKYSLDNFPKYVSKYIDYNNIINCDYEYSDTYEGTIIFSKIDKENYIISGTFEFSTKKDGCEDIKITQGVFDLKYIP
tara:strand:- start:3313 stop:3846 length:534 start_codon:yes stop_codon:yes gene_type:complete